ncbi:MAG: energy-coupling factor transporter transmembrane component T [Chloroflexota bacterium]|nr:energy-coupling factor transporter transmembrane component T [Chloroflexota bacterium]
MHKLAYHPGSGVLHQLYPLNKLVWLVLGSILVFVVSNGALLISITALLFLILLFVYPAIWRVRGFRFASLTGLFLFLLYLLFDKSGAVIWDPWLPLFRLTLGGLTAGMRFSGRFLSIVCLSYLFVLTTEPADLAYSLMRAGLPYRFGFMLVTALRLAPILEEEGRTIYQAQLVRGIQYDRRGIGNIITLSQQFLTPLLIGALRRADKLVFSMEGRGFGQYPGRTFRRQKSPTSLDVVFNFLMIVLSGIALFINFGGEI